MLSLALMVYFFSLFNKTDSFSVFLSTCYLSATVSVFATSSRCGCLRWLTEPSLASPSPTGRAPSRQLQPIDQTFYFHADDQWGAETPCSQVCKGAQVPPSPRLPVTVTGADAALAANCPEADDKFGQPTSLSWENAKQFLTRTLTRLRDSHTVTLSRWAFAVWVMVSLFSGCYLCEGVPSGASCSRSRRKLCLVLTGLIHGVFMIASLVFSPFSTSGQPLPCFSAS